VGGRDAGTVFKLTQVATIGTSVMLAVAPNPAPLGQTLTFTATVSSSQGTPTGSVTFYFNGGPVGTGTLNDAGVATFSLSTVGDSIKSYTAIAGSSGSSTYKISQSGLVTVTLTKAIPGVNITASPNPAVPPASVTLTAYVTGVAGTPTGTVTFRVNGTCIGSKTLSGNSVTLTASTSGLPYGTYPVVATYSGDATYTSGHSATLPVVLAKNATSVTLSGAPNPVTPPASVTLVAAVERSASGATGVPTGTVTFYFQTTALGTATLNQSGEAVLTASSEGIPAGNYAITAKYSGDSSDAVSTSTPLTITVK
jgi:hypothetical protein